MGGPMGGDEPPAAFRAALDALAGVRARPEIVLEHIPAPQRLAPWAHAVGARVAEPGTDEDDDLEIASARFIVLFDPDGHEAWNGTTRCVGYLSAATDEELVDDAMFSEVAWSWLTDALDRLRGDAPQRRRHRHPHGLDPLRRPRRPRAHRRRRDARLLDGGGHRPRPSPVGLARGAGQRGRSAAARSAPAGSLRPERQRDSLTSVPPAGRRPAEPGPRRPDRRGPARRWTATEHRAHSPTGRASRRRRPQRTTPPRPSRSSPPATDCPRSSRPPRSWSSTPRRCGPAPARSPSTPSAPRATATASAPTSCRCAATARAPA